MSLTSKDIVGLTLAAGTLVLLLVHGSGRHEVPVSGSAPATIAFVDVRLGDRGPGRAEAQVVVVRDGIVTEIGRAGTVHVPARARIVDGGGSGYLVAAPQGAPADGAWAPVVPGTTSDLLLLATHPGDKILEDGTLRGRTEDGIWLPARSGGTSASTAAAGGH